MPTETHLLNEAYDKVRQPKQLLTEAALNPVAEIKLNRAEIQMIMGSGVREGSVGVKLHKALKEIAEYEAMGARHAKDVYDFQDYMSGGYASAPKRMLKIQAAKDKERHEKQMKNDPVYRKEQEEWAAGEPERERQHQASMAAWEKLQAQREKRRQRDLARKARQG